MSFISLGTEDQLQIRIPIQRSTGWAQELIEEFFQKVVEHDHSGNGKGVALGVGSLGDNIVGSANIRLANGEGLRSRNGADDADLSILSVNSLDLVEFGSNIAALIVEGILAQVPVSADPISPIEGQLQIADGTVRPAGLYSYVDGAWLASPNNVSASNQGTGEGIFIQRTGDDLELKSITVGEDLEVTSSATEIEVALSNNVAKIDNVIDTETYSTNTLFTSTSNGTAIVGSLQPNTRYKLRAKLIVTPGAFSSDEVTFSPTLFVDIPGTGSSNFSLAGNRDGQIPVGSGVTSSITAQGDGQSGRAIIILETPEFTIPDITDLSNSISIGIRANVSGSTVDVSLVETISLNISGSVFGTATINETSEIELIQVD